jgi:cytochrome c5
MNMKRTLVIAFAAALASLAAAGASIAAPRGDKVYDKTCVVCHDTGLSGAPRLGNRSEWAPRMSAGIDALVSSVKNGKGQMPPKGGNDKFTEEELRAAVEYMLAKVR